MTTRKHKSFKRFCCYDFDGTLIDSPEKEEGIVQWEKIKGVPYPYQGWWGRKESLDTEVFDIKPFPNILSKLNSDLNSNSHVIILTSRMEKLRPELENVLKVNGIQVDEVIMKRGAETKGDVILRIAKYNPDLEYVVAYDDFANDSPEKIKEYTDIKDELESNGIEYNVVRVVNGRVSNMMESTNILNFMIQDEVLKFRNEYL